MAYNRTLISICWTPACLPRPCALISLRHADTLFPLPGQRSCLSGHQFAVSRGASPISWDNRSYFNEVVFLKRSFWYSVAPFHWSRTSSLCPRRAVSEVEPKSLVSDLHFWNCCYAFPSVSLYDPDLLLILLLIHAPGEDKPDFGSRQVSGGFFGLFYIYRTSLSRQLNLQKSSVDGSVALLSVLGLGYFFCFVFLRFWTAEVSV